MQSNSTPLAVIHSPQQVEEVSWCWCWQLAVPHCNCGSSRRMCWRCSGSSASLSCCLTGTLSKQKVGVGESEGWTSRYVKLWSVITMHRLRLGNIYIWLFACWAVEANEITGNKQLFVGCTSKLLLCGAMLIHMNRWDLDSMIKWQCWFCWPGLAETLIRK